MPGKGVVNYSPVSLAAMTSAVALCTVRPLPVHGHTFTGFDTAQINAAAIVNDAGLLLARIPHRGAKRRFAAVCQFDYRHRLLPGNHFKSAVADGTFGQRRLYHRFNRFRPSPSLSKSILALLR